MSLKFVCRFTDTVYEEHSLSKVNENDIMVLIFGDSRCFNLHRHIDSWSSLDVDRILICSWRGATVETFYDRILNIVGEFSHKRLIIKICLGVNNLLNADSPVIVFEKLKNLKNAIHRLCQCCLPSFGDIIPVDLENVNCKGNHQFSTHWVNTRIESLNKMFYAENKVCYPPFSRGGATTFLSQIVRKERCKKSVTGKKYRVQRSQNSLMYDGIHGVPVCKLKTSKALVASCKVDIKTVLNTLVDN